MKKIVITLCTVLVLTALAACNMFGPSPDEVRQKIENSETLTREDYNTIIDYLDDFTDAQAKAGDSSEAWTKVNEDYPLWMTFAFSLAMAPRDIRETKEYQDLYKKLDKGPQAPGPLPDGSLPPTE